MRKKNKKSFKEMIEELKIRKSGLDNSKYGAYLHSIKTLGRGGAHKIRIKDKKRNRRNKIIYKGY